MGVETVAKKALAYYNYDKLYSYNGIFNFLVGARGLGKTYGAKCKAISRAINYGEQFVYLRRYKTELSAKTSFFADCAHEFPDWDFRVNGELAEMSHVSKRDDKKRAWKTIGYFVALSSAAFKKSVAYPLVRTIIFDEFIIEKGLIHYLPNEEKAFKEFFSTVDRNGDKTRVFFLANSVTIHNPYFLAYKIEPKDDVEFMISHKGFIVSHFADSAEFRAGVNQTRFGQFIVDSDPEYADYALSNKFSDNHNHLIKKKMEEAKYTYTLETRSGVFSVWIDWGDFTFYLQEKRPKSEMIYTTETNKMADGKILTAKNDKQMVMLRAAFKRNKMYFDKPKTRQIFVEVFNR